MKPFDGIAITTATWHEMSNKIISSGNAIEQILQHNCYLKNYGMGIRGILFIFIAMGIDDVMHKERKAYLAQDRQLDIFLKLKYPQIEQAQGVAESLPLMAALFLDSIPTYYPTLKIPDFDWQRFALDVKLLFIRKKWLDRTWTMEEKEQLTQLPPNTIELIEHTPTAATVADLIQYCKNLRLPYTSVCPELSLINHLLA